MVVLLYLLAGFIDTAARLDHPLNWAVYFWLSSYCHICSSTGCFDLFESGCQLSVSYFLSCAHCSNGVFSWVLSAICCRDVSVFTISVMFGALGTIPKGFMKGLEDLEIKWQVEIIQTTALSRSARILRRFLKTCRDFLLLKLP